jgi:hypothetical protein
MTLIERLIDRLDQLPTHTFEMDNTDGPSLKQAIRQKGFVMNPIAEHVLDSMTEPSEYGTITIVKFHLEDIDMPPYMDMYDIKDYRMIVEALNRHGLTVCPPLTAPKLSMLDVDLIKRKETVHVLTEPIIDSSGTARIFQLNRSQGKLNLDAYRIGIFYNDGLVIAKIPSPN